MASPLKIRKYRTWAIINRRLKLKSFKKYNIVRRISYCFLFFLRIEEIDSGKINTDENLIRVVETSMDDDE